MPFARIWRYVKQNFAGSIISFAFSLRVLQEEVLLCIFVYALYTNLYNKYNIMRICVTRFRENLNVNIFTKKMIIKSVYIKD